MAQHQPEPIDKHRMSNTSSRASAIGSALAGSSAAGSSPAGSSPAGSAPAGSAPAQQESAAQDLHRVREILFGAQQRSSDERLQSMQRDFEERLAGLATRLTTQMASERDEAAREHETLRGQVATLNQQVETLGEQKEAMQASVQALREELVQKMSLIEDCKLDKEDLAEMFGGMVSRLGKVAASSNGGVQA
ncbi:MAG: hypothetical protein AB8H80_02810 [Planctomycetota bacterium]